MYMQSPPWDSGITPPEVVEYINAHPPGRAIDLGCGTGTNVLTLAEHGWEVTGIDFTPKAIRQARRKAKNAGKDVKLMVGDVSNSAHYHGHYDLMLDIGCYHALNQEQRGRYRENIFSHLAPGGTYMLYAFFSPDGGRLSPADITAFESGLALARREDSADPTGPTSTWLWFTTKGN